MRPTRLAGIAALSTLGCILPSVAVMPSPNAYMTHDSTVRKTSSPSSAVVNFVAQDDEVQVLQCGTSRCKIKISGPDGWVKKSYIAFFEEEEEEEDYEEPVADLPYGPDTCVDGYVWRDAIPGDHVCVTPDRRTAAATENAIAGTRVDPAGAYGPNSCVVGFVWREAYSGDVVCVTPDRRSQVHQENLEGPSYRVLS